MFAIYAVNFESLKARTSQCLLISIRYYALYVVLTLCFTLLYVYKLIMVVLHYYCSFVTNFVYLSSLHLFSIAHMLTYNFEYCCYTNNSDLFMYNLMLGGRQLGAMLEDSTT